MASVKTRVGMVAVRELTAAEIRDWLKDMITADPAGEIDLADYLLFEHEGLRVSDFLRLTDMEPEALWALTPSELEDIGAKCREVNPRFFSVLGKVLATGHLAIQQRASTTSNAPAPSSRGWFARMFGRGRGAG